MYSGDGTRRQSGLVEQAGTLDFHSLTPSAISKPNGSYTEDPSSRQDLRTSGTGLDEGQTLEWHEVIELQAFSERKAWIEEKIKVWLIHAPLLRVATEDIQSSLERCHPLKCSRD